MRKCLAWLLAVCLLAGLCVNAGAQSFSDADKIQNLDAVTLMADLGLVQGYRDGSFLPRNNIRRSEAAKLVALICQNSPQAAKSVTFSDVSGWAAEFVAYCHEKGIISGYNGKFRPNDYVTGREFAKMLLVCLGYPSANYTGGNWVSAVDGDAQRLKIYTGYDSDPGRYLSRDEACLLMYNAMQCYAVVGKDSSGRDVYALDELMNPMTYMEYRFHVVKFSGVLEANEFADLTTDGGRLASGKSKLAGHLTLNVSTPYEFLGRQVEIYTIRQQDGSGYRVIGIPHLVEAEISFTTDREESYVMALQYAGLTPSDKTAYYINGDSADVGFAAYLGSDYSITAVDRDKDGLLDVVLVTDYVQGTVTGEEPLTVSCGGTEQPGAFFGAETKPLHRGDTVRCVNMGGMFRIP